MKKLIGGAGLALMLAACATSNSPVAPTEVASVESNKGAVTIVGLPASQVLGAIDTTKLVGSEPDKVVANQPKGPEPAPTITQEGNVLRVEGVPPAAVLAAIDPTKLISKPKAEGDGDLPPEVAAVVKNNKRYTTKQLAEAQLNAVRNGKPG